MGLILLVLGLVVSCDSAERPPALPTPLVAATAVAVNTPTLVAVTPTAAATRTPTSVPSPTVTATVAAETETVLANGRSIGDAYIPELGNTGYDVQRYTLKLALDPKVKVVEGTTLIEAVTTKDTLTQISFDFIGFKVEAVQIGRKRVFFAREGGKLIVNLPQPLAVDEPFTVLVAYQGEPVRQSSPYVGFVDALGLHYAGAQDIYAFSEPDGARYWFPNNDHPRDKARFRFELTVPAALTAVANGRLVGIKADTSILLPGGQPGRTFVWQHDYPMATYLALVAVAPFQRIDGTSPAGVPLRHYVVSDVREEFEAAAAVTAEALDWMSDLFGPYPFDAFGYVTADLPPLAMETQTMPILSHDLIGPRTAVHEMAHMWFGNWVSLNSWSEMWRNEGFATYVALMWQTGDDPEALDLEIESVLAAVEQNDPQYPLNQPPPQYLFGFNTYYKGAALLHVLRRQIGDEAFFAGLRLYLQRYGGGTASDAEFQAVMEEAAGVSLQAFFAEWLN